MSDHPHPSHQAPGPPQVSNAINGRLVELLLNHSRDGVFLCDGEGRLLRVNHAFSALLGNTPEAFIGQPLSAILNDPANPEGLPRQVQESLSREGGWEGEVWQRRQDGASFLTSLRLMAVEVEGEVHQLLGLVAELDQRNGDKQGAKRGGDHLTGLPDRLLFQDRLQQALSQARRQGKCVGVLQMDLDRFKLINESLGHDAGDQVLKTVANQLTVCLRTSDSVSRIGADAFAMLLSDLGRQEDAVRNASIVARKLYEAINTHFTYAEHVIDITAAMGITLYPQDGDTPDALMKNAETALHHARSKGWNNYQFFSQEMTDAARERFVLEASLRRAVERQELLLHYQPQVDLKDGRVIGAEALIRWQHPEKGMISPGFFVPVAEETGLIVPIGAWVLRTACQQLAQWRDMGLPPLRMGVNISAVQFRRQNLTALVQSVLAETGIDPRQLELEITESAIMDDVEKAVATLTRINQLGVKLSIDDFGTGYSSLSQLRQFPFKTLKIDRSFVKDIHASNGDTAIISAIVAMAHGLNLNVIAEGLENQEQLHLLKQLQCNEMQGFLFSRPLPADAFTELLRQGVRLE